MELNNRPPDLTMYMGSGHLGNLTLTPHRRARMRWGTLPPVPADARAKRQPALAVLTRTGGTRALLCRGALNLRSVGRSRYCAV